MASNPTTIYFLIIGCLVLSFIYLILGINSLICVWKVFKQKATFFGRSFYFFMFLTCISLATIQGLFLQKSFKAIQSANDQDVPLEQYKNLLLDSVYVPDMLFLLVYFSMFWHLLILCEKGFMKSGDFHYQQRGFDPSLHVPKIKIIFFIYSVCQVALVLVYNLSNGISVYWYVVLDIGMNGSIPLALIVAQFYLNIKFSGAISRSHVYEKRTRRMNQLTVFWAFMRIPQITLNLVILLLQDRIFEFVQGTLNVSTGTQVFLVFFGVGAFLLSTVIPFVAAMSQDMIEIFLLDKKEKTLLSKTVPSSELKNEAESVTLSMQSHFQSQLMKLMVDELIIPFEEVQYDINEPINKKINKLGTIYPIRLKSLVQSENYYVARVIDISELSSYVIDEVKKDIHFINQHRSHLVQICGISISKQQLLIVYKKHENGSLHTLLHQDRDKQEIFKSIHSSGFKSVKSHEQNQHDFKIGLALKIAQSINHLHSLNPPVFHGHLTPHNILFRKQFDVVLSDIRLNVLKKYVGLITGYTDKSQYTAPEDLLERGNICSGGLEKDVYSFGMILYEIFTDTIPFNDLQLKQCQQMIGKQQLRPVMKEFIPEPIQSLIMHCWQQEPKNRPTMEMVVSVLKQVDT